MQEGPIPCLSLYLHLIGQYLYMEDTQNLINEQARNPCLTPTNVLQSELPAGHSCNYLKNGVIIVFQVVILKWANVQSSHAIFHLFWFSPSDIFFLTVGLIPPHWSIQSMIRDQYIDSIFPNKMFFFSILSHLFFFLFSFLFFFFFLFFC